MLSLSDRTASGRLHEAIRKIDLAEDGGRRYGGAMALQQAIQGNDRQAARDQHFRADTPDVARGAGNENIHL